MMSKRVKISISLLVLFLCCSIKMITIADMSWISNYPELKKYKDDANHDLYEMLIKDVWQYAFNDKDIIYPDLTVDQAVMKALEPYIDGVTFPSHQLLTNYFSQLYIEGYISNDVLYKLGYSEDWVDTLQLQQNKIGSSEAAQTPQYEPCDTFTVWTTTDINYRGQAGAEYEFIGELPVHTQMDVIGTYTTIEKNLEGSEKEIQWFCFVDEQDRMGFVSDMNITYENPRNRTFSYYNYESSEKVTLNFQDENPDVIDKIIDDRLTKNKEYVEKKYSYPVSRYLQDEGNDNADNNDIVSTDETQDTVDNESDEKIVQNNDRILSILNFVEIFCAAICVVSLIGIFIVSHKRKKKL